MEAAVLDAFDREVEPIPGAEAAIAAVDALTHVGDDREADGGIDRYGGRYLHVDGDLTGPPERLAAGVGTEAGGNH